MAKEKVKYFKQAICRTKRNENEFGVFCLEEKDAVIGKEIELWVGYVYIIIIPTHIYQMRIEHKIDEN